MRALAAFLALATAAAHALPAGEWPSLDAPPGARVEALTGDVVLNGRPARVTRATAAGTPQELRAFYRQQFGAQRVVENRVQDALVIATRQAHHFHTVQLRDAAPGYTVATIMTTRLDGEPVRSATALNTERLLPGATAVVSTLESRDGGLRSVTVIGMNAHSAGANRDHFVARLQEQGFRIVHEEPSAGRLGALSILMASPTEEVDLAISDAGAQRMVLVNRRAQPR